MLLINLETVQNSLQSQDGWGQWENSEWVQQPDIPFALDSIGFRVIISSYKSKYSIMAQYLNIYFSEKTFSEYKQLLEIT